MQIDDSWYHRPPGVAAHDSAGGVVVRVDGDRLLVALQREGPRRAYTLPKGHVEGGESVEDAARRETLEETGLRDLALLGPLGVRERLNFDRTSWKRTHYMLFLDARETAPAVPGPAEFALEWFPIDALPEMFWPEQHELIESSREHIRAAVTRHGVRRQFSRRAGAYARSKSHAHDRDLALLIRHLRLRREDRVLDVATGTGFTAFAAAELSHHVVGLDLTLGMLVEARRLDPAGPIKWVAADAGAIPFAGGTFDAVTVRRAPHHFPRLEPAIREMLRVLRPGGRIGIIDQVPPDDESGHVLMERLEKIRDKTHVEMYARARWRALVENLGVILSFSDVVERKLTFESWLDLAGADQHRRQSVLDALASAPMQARIEIGDDGSEPRSFTKRWVVLVGEKALGK